MSVYCAMWCVLEYILIIYDYLSIKDRGATMGGGGQSRPLIGPPPLERQHFFLYGGGAFSSCGDLFATLIFSMCLTDTPPPSLRKFLHSRVYFWYHYVINNFRKYCAFHINFCSWTRARRRGKVRCSLPPGKKLCRGLFTHVEFFPCVENV